MKFKGFKNALKLKNILLFTLLYRIKKAEIRCDYLLRVPNILGFTVYGA